MAAAPGRRQASDEQARGRPTLQQLVELIAACKSAEALHVLAAAPELARISLNAPSRAKAEKFFERIMHYAYAGDTALHLAAAAYDVKVVKALLKRGARVGARNRRGAEPLHYASDGHADAPAWNPKAQAATIALLLEAGADPNALDKSGVAPLHRAARTRCSAAVRALLTGGAKAELSNASGSTARQLAEKSTGRGGSGSAAAKREQELILKLLQA